MLSRLLLDRIVRRDHKHSQVDTSCTREHLPHKLFVAGDVDNTESKVAKIQFSKTELNGDAAFLFFRQSVRVDPRQRSDQRGLSVIDVAGGTQNEMCGHAIILKD